MAGGGTGFPSGRRFSFYQIRLCTCNSGAFSSHTSGTFIATITEGIRMDDIVRNTKAEVQRLRYDADGCLMLVEDGK